jgi:hypothetical protein
MLTGRYPRWTTEKEGIKKVIYPKTEKRPIASNDQVQLREKILKESVQTRAQLWFILGVMVAGREVAKQQSREDWTEQFNNWIDPLGSMYNMLLYLQSNVYEFGINTKFMRLKDLQSEMKRIKEVRTNPLFIRCLQEIPDALNAPVNTIEEEMAMLKAENDAARTAKFEGPDPWAA